MSVPETQSLLHAATVPLVSHRDQLYTRPFLLLCACYILIQYAVAVHSVTDFALYRFLFCTKLYPRADIRFDNGLITNRLCAAESISKQVALLTGTLGLFENVPGTILVLFYGRLSDKFGRRPIFFLLLAGGVLQNMITLYTATHYASTGTAYFYLASFVAGIAGTNPALRTVTWSMIVDLVPSPHNRLLAFSAIASFNYLGMILGPSTGSLLLSYKLLAPLTISTFLLSLAILIVWCMPETAPHPCQSEGIADPDAVHDGFYITLTSSLAKHCRDLSHLLISNNATILAVITFIWNFTGGVMLLVVQYLNQDFQWSFTSGGYFYSVFAGLKVLVLLAFLPLFMKFARERRWSNIDHKLLTLGLIGDGIAYCSYAITSAAALPLILLLQALCAPLSVSLRVLISQLASLKTRSGQEYGAGRIFATMSVLEGVGDLAGPAVWNSVYAALLAKQGERLVFVFVGCAYFSGALAALFYDPQSPSNQDTGSLIASEDAL